MFAVQTLNNQVKVVELEPVSYLSGIGIWIPRGMLVESAGEAGWTHLCEHLCFRRQINGNHDAFILSIESLGMIYSAHTAQEYVGFFARFPEHKFERGVKALFDIAFSPIDVDLPTVQKEIAIVSKEDQMPSGAVALAQDLSINQLLGQRCMTPGAIKTFDEKSLADLYSFHRKNFHPAGAVVVFTHKNSCAALETIVSILREYLCVTDNASSPVLQRKAEQSPVTRIYESTAGTECVSMAYLFPGRADTDHDLANLFCRLIGLGLASRVYQRVVVRDARAYTIHLKHKVFNQVSALALACSSSEKAPGFASYFIGAVREEFGKMQTEGFSEDEIQGAAEHFLSYTHALAENKTKFMVNVAERAMSNKGILDIREAAAGLASLPMPAYEQFTHKYLTDNSSTAILLPKKV